MFGVSATEAYSERPRRRYRALALFSESSRIQTIPIGQLQSGPWQPRRVFDKESLAELASSIKAQGVLTPLRVIRSRAGAGYLIVAGERRWRAAALAGITELPCLVMKKRVHEDKIHELAILDNLHRANLRPGEEARALNKLSRLGLTQHSIAERLAKSQTWVSHRLAMAKLPDIALDQLDSGSITREEAIALTKLADRSDLIEACLDPTGRPLKTWLPGRVPQGISERVQAILRSLETDRQRQAWATRMRSEGHVILNEEPRVDDRRYVRLLQGSELARAHQAARLVCEVWAWEYGRPVRYCSDPGALRKAMGNARRVGRIEQARQEEQRRATQREAARDAILKAWAATSRGLDRWALTILAKERVRTLSMSDGRALGRLGHWLGFAGDRATCALAAEKELATASGRRLIQLWFMLEFAQATSYCIIPAWVRPFLEKLGFIDPTQTSLAARGNRTLRRPLKNASRRVDKHEDLRRRLRSASAAVRIPVPAEQQRRSHLLKERGTISQTRNLRPSLKVQHEQES